MISLIVRVTDQSDHPSAHLIAPIGLATPQSAPTAVIVQGADMQLIADPTAAQHAMRLTPTGGPITLTWRFARPGAPYPQALFTPRDSRFTRAAPSLAEEAKAIATAAGGGADGIAALAAHAAGLFDYGHPEQKFYDGHDEIPQLCDIATGSCVDINAYFIALCRSAGYQAGYVTGYFIPVEKRSQCDDMHCWVVTRCDDVVQEWDIAHHLKIGRRNIAPGLNPKPGVRLAMAHSMGLNFPAEALHDLKLISEPMWLDAAGQWARANLTINLTGYDLLDRPDPPVQP